MSIKVNTQIIEKEKSEIAGFEDLIDEYRHLNRYEYLDKLYKKWVKDDFNKDSDFKIVNNRLREIRCIFIDNNISPRHYN